MSRTPLTPEQIAEDLRLHDLWCRDEPGGKRIDWSGAYLAGANLAGANMDGANLAGAYLVRANLAGANMDGARGFLPFVCVGPIGSRHGYTTISLTKDEIRCGCFTGTLEAFEKQVQRTHKDNPLHLAEYTAVAAMARAIREAQPPREATPEPPAPFTEGQTVQLTEAGRKHWPWAPTGSGEVCRCRGGWTRVKFDTRYLSIPDAFVELAEAAVEGASA